MSMNAQIVLIAHVQHIANFVPFDASFYSKRNGSLRIKLKKTHTVRNIGLYSYHKQSCYSIVDQCLKILCYHCVEIEKRKEQ